MAKRLAVTLSLGASVTVFTLLLRATTALIDIPTQVWQIASLSCDGFASGCGPPVGLTSLASQYLFGLVGQLVGRCLANLEMFRFGGWPAEQV